MRARVSAGLPLLLAAWLGLSAGPGQCGEPTAYTATDFRFEDGSILPEVRIAYQTYGTLSPARDNAVVLLHDARGDRHSFDALIGPGKLFDTERYFVITPDAIGGGESISPAEGAGQDFPRYSIRDIVAAEYELVAMGLGLTQLRAVLGRSMGAFVALEWAIHHPESVGRLVLIGPALRTAPSLDLVFDEVASVIALDPDWEGGRYSRNPVEGLRHAGMVFYPWAVSARHLDRLSPHALAQEVEAEAQSFAAWDANALVWRHAACRGFDIAQPFDGNTEAALVRGTMPVLLLASPDDRLIGADGARRLRDAVPGATYVEIASELGHRALAPPPESAEAGLIDRAVRAFLATGGR
jgi:homoserine O-acetyltransferase